MEPQDILKAAQAGKLRELKTFLKDKSDQEIKAMTSCVINGTTPLIIACINGHIDVATYLIEECHVEIDQSVCSHNTEQLMLFLADSDGVMSSITVPNFELLNSYINLNTCKENDGRHFWTALFCAIARSNLHLVAYLINNGADIEKATDGRRCTPLMQACIIGNHRIVQLLLNKNVDIHRKDISGNTALHWCASTVAPSTVDIIKLLIDRGAGLIPNNSGHTPLVIAAKSCNKIAVDLFIQHFNIDKVQKIEVFEVLGAFYLLHKNNIPLSNSFFQEAIDLSFEDTEIAIKKPRLSSTLSSAIGETYGLYLEHLDEPDRMRKQALLIVEKVFSPSSLECIKCVTEYIQNTPVEESLTMHFHLVMYIFDNLLIYKDPEESYHVFNDLLNFFIEKFTEIFEYTEIPPISFENLLLFLQKIIKVFSMLIPHDKPFKRIDNLMHKIVEFLGLVCISKPSLTEDEEFNYRQIVYELVSLKFRTRRGFTVLHIACSLTDVVLNISSPNSGLEFPTSSVVDLLLAVGADASAIDKCGNTPLHMIAKHKPYDHDLFMSVLKRGGHLDICNRVNETPLQLARKCGFDLNPISYISLQCLSAQVVRTYNIIYKGCVSKKLEEFLDIH